MGEKLSQNKGWIAVIAAIAAAFAGGSSVDYVPDADTLARLGPLGIAIVIYAEVRWRALAIDIRDSLRVLSGRSPATVESAAKDLDDGIDPAAVITKLTERKSGPVLARAKTHGR